MQGKGEIYLQKTKSGWWLPRSDCNGAIFWRCELAEQKLSSMAFRTLKIAPHILTLKQTAVAKSDGVFTYDFTPSQFSAGDKKILSDFIKCVAVKRSLLSLKLQQPKKN
ncbi:hypothetical protein J4731_19490 [Providencia rettgeri]|nr:hypothetical protein [Providencia rettgeri]